MHCTQAELARARHSVGERPRNEKDTWYRKGVPWDFRKLFVWLRVGGRVSVLEYLATSRVTAILLGTKRYPAAYCR